MSDAKPFNHGLYSCHIPETLAVMRVLEEIVKHLKFQTQEGAIKLIDPIPLLERVTATYEQLMAHMAQAAEELDKKK